MQLEAGRYLYDIQKVVNLLAEFLAGKTSAHGDER